VAGAECVALCDRDRGKAEALARERGVTGVYTDVVEMLDREKPEFLDIITDVTGHVPCALEAFARGIPTITQKPMAPSLAEAEAIAARAREAGVPFFVHENWRWQAPLRAVKEVLDAGTIGPPFRARITMVSGFPVFINQPGLKDQERFLLADMATHILDTARFFFGEPQSLYCHAQQVHADIKGEDVATVMMKMGGQTTVVCEMGFPENHLENDFFPETFLLVEGARGSIELSPHFWLRVTTAEGTHARRVPPPRYPWANPDYDVVHASMVACNTNLLGAIRGEGAAETTAEDNLKTLRIVEAAYDSAANDEVVRF
jgi:predicted dehydrogenase